MFRRGLVLTHRANLILASWVDDRHRFRVGTAIMATEYVVRTKLELSGDSVDSLRLGAFERAFKQSLLNEPHVSWIGGDSAPV